MKKFLIFAIATLGMLACTGQNQVDNGENDPSNQIINGALPGKFSISDNKQVQFSQGNLRYQIETGTWSFAEQQYDIIGPTDKGGYKLSDGWIDVFGWGTGDNPVKSSQFNEEYGTFVDWGQNQISNGCSYSWRTLTEEEWRYLCNGREGAEFLHWYGIIEGIFGIIFLPDNWSANAPYDVYDVMDSYGETYSLADWEKLEKAGAVFLPAAYTSYIIKEVQIMGRYWSASPKEYYSAYSFHFYRKDGDWYAVGGDYYGKSVKHSVRLVRDVPK